jgi:ABC-type multidrug transport system fused ATPase/permease subunit
MVASGHHSCPGQKQRVTLARALLADSDHDLPDDALSSVDTRPRSTSHALEERWPRPHRILVAHRLSTVQDADLILVLDQGPHRRARRPRARCSPGGLYADLFQRQRLSEELEA